MRARRRRKKGGGGGSSSSRSGNVARGLPWSQSAGPSWIASLYARLASRVTRGHWSGRNGKLWEVTKKW